VTRPGGVKPLDQNAQQTPEMLFAGIAAYASEFAAFFDHDEQRCEPLNLNESEIGWQGSVDIDPP
jgi:hypothetical protein